MTRFKSSRTDWNGVSSSEKTSAINAARSSATVPSWLRERPKLALVLKIIAVAVARHRKAWCPAADTEPAVDQLAETVDRSQSASRHSILSDLAGHEAADNRGIAGEKLFKQLRSFAQHDEFLPVSTLIAMSVDFSNLRLHSAGAILSRRNRRSTSTLPGRDVQRRDDPISSTLPRRQPSPRFFGGGV